jgi:NADPH:quinone reductase-like Zn-dependent oxidoreductase
VTKYKAGDAVFAFFNLKGEGGYAEFVAAKENELAAKPEGVSFTSLTTRNPQNSKRTAFAA